MAYTTIDDPSKYFQTTLWTGNATDDRSITNTGNSDLQPDFVWIKSRETTNDHLLFNSTVGVGKYLRANATDGETTIADTLQGFESDGIEIGADSRLNTNADPVVSWQWKANGGTTSSNSDGDITSTVQANTTAGFSIVTWTGNGTDEDTVGHGLSGNWDVAIVKNRGETDYWTFSRTGTSSVLLLHDSTSEANHSTAYLTKSSGVIGLVGAGDLGMVNGSSETYVAYVFKEIQGYSKFGSYTGNGNADGPFVYTGFKPAWLMVKNTTSSRHWQLMDNKRSTSNVIDDYLQANASGAQSEGSSQHKFDFLSNGFKLRGTADNVNDSGDTHVFMAFAEQPFVSSKGVPCTAR